MIQQSAQHLQSYLGELLAAIAKSVKMCPANIRATFRQLFTRVGERFPENKHKVSRLVLLGLVCLVWGSAGEQALQGPGEGCHTARGTITPWGTLWERL